MDKTRPLPRFLGLLSVLVLSPLWGQTPSQPAEQRGPAVAEEARVLALEDRREIDSQLVRAWVKHPDPIYRKRIALALGRIGAHAFVDRNENKSFDQGSETRVGVEELTQLVSDRDRDVRIAVAFALGEIGDEACASPLSFLGSDSDPGVAAEAAEAYSKLAVANRMVRIQGFSRYKWLLDEKSPEAVRARATRFLFRFDSDEASALASSALASTSATVRQEAAYTLARRGYAPAEASLRGLASDPNVLTRSYAAAALGRIAQPSSLPSLLGALTDSHPWVRVNAAVAISKVLDRDRRVIAAEHLPRILGAADDPDPGVRAAVIDVLGYYATGDARAAKRLVGALKEGTRWERELAAGAIAKHFAPETDMFKELTDLTAWQIVRVIQATTETRQGVSLRKQYGGHPESMVRAASVGSIPDSRVDAEVEHIRAAFADPDVMVRAAAYDRYGLVTVDPPSAWIPRLLQAEKRERGEVMNDGRIAAIQALSKFASRGLRGFLGPLLEDPDPVVRRIAAEEITKVSPKESPQYAPLPVRRTAEEYAEIIRWSRQAHTATIHTVRGKIELALLSREAPITAWNFAQLARKKYFDGTSFMRVVPNFVIQGGDPRNDMTGGPGYAIRDEINMHRFTRAAVGMALSGPDTGGSQFFITHSQQPHLDGGYTIFGRVYDGMNTVVDQIERGDRVDRITIDEHPAVDEEKVWSVPNVSLPLEIGTFTHERVLALQEYEQRKQAYRPDITVLEMMKSYVRPDDRIEVYMGTWCDDSQREVPKLLRILEDLRSQFGTAIPVRFVAIDRSKQKPSDLIAGKSVTKVATFIYYRGDRELGRIEERPKGILEDEILAIAGSEK